MKQPAPSPEFDPGRYERPNQKWVCGKLAEGRPCRIGPGRHGQCRATSECQPLLELKEGEKKGRYRCTRTTALGRPWPCDVGALPDGGCSRPISKCVPVRTLLARRKHLTISTATLTLGLLLVGLSTPFRARFVSPGAISAPHATERFAKEAGLAGAGEKSCAACHQAAQAGLSGLLSSAFNATPGPLQLRWLAARQPLSATPLDQNCLRCHVGYSFHQTNTVRQHSCSACHVEHHGPSPMGAPRDANCLSCHADNTTMAASAGLGRTLPAVAFDYQSGPGEDLFRALRPERGYTKPINSFATDHPEFQLLREHLTDTDTLRFNHQVHLDLKKVFRKNGEKPICQDCHKTEASGAYYLRISYQENCAACHQLQFDARNPSLLVPHGDAKYVRDFLRSLDRQYADYGLKIGKNGTDLQTFVQDQIAKLRADVGSGELLEEKIFFSDSRTAPAARVGEQGSGASVFPGCAKCHEVTRSGSEVPIVTRPFIPDRWLTRGKFDHSKHLKVACAECHSSENSHLTSDILLPSKQICVRCHGPQGGVVENCSTCHNYHLLRNDNLTAR